MSLILPSSYRQEISHALDLDEAKTRAKRAADTMRWRLRKETDGNLVFRVGINWRSWGEEVTMTFRPREVSLYSKCRWITQFVDWGKNQSNCEAIAKVYEEP